MAGMTNGWKPPGIAIAALIAVFAAGDAFAQSAECARLQAAIAAAPRGGGQLQAAAERARADLSHASAYARSLGCDNQKFLFFGSDPPPQCGEVKGQIARMQANLADLQSRAGGPRGDLIARYNAECASAPRPPNNIFEALFGGVRQALVSPDMLPPDQQEQMIEQSIENEKKGANVSAGSYAVCVRTCDGSFFPVSYSGAGSRSDSLEEVCRSLCPNADVQLYSFPFGGTVNQAVSTAGERYVDLPNALKFQQSFDSSCSCRRKGEGWAQALANAEAKYGHESRDIVVTPEKSAEMARPIIKTAADPKAKNQKAAKATAPAPDAAPATGAAQIPGGSPQTAGGAAQASGGAAQTAGGVTSAPGAATASGGVTPTLDANGADTTLSAAAAAVSREASGIAGGETRSGAVFGKGQGQTVSETGPDGVTRKVRIVAPTL